MPLEQRLPATEIVRADLDHPEHARAIRDLLAAFALEPVSGGQPLAPGILDGIVPGLRNHPASLVILARQGGDYVGAAICFVGFSTFYARPLVNIHDLTVLDACRGQGIGRKLMAAVEAEARAMNACKVTLEVRENNTGARRLYASEGFRGDNEPAGDNYYFLQKVLD